MKVIRVVVPDEFVDIFYREIEAAIDSIIRDIAHANCWFKPEYGIPGYEECVKKIVDSIRRDVSIDIEDKI